VNPYISIIKMQTVPVDLSKNQVIKLLQGKKIRLSKKALQGGSFKLSLGPHQVAKIEKALKKGKGTEIFLDEHELSKNGEGLKDWLKKAGHWIKKELGPIAKKGIKKLIDVGSTAAEVMFPEAAPFIEMGKNRFGDKLVDKIGDVTHLYSGHGMYPMHLGGEVNGMRGAQSTSTFDYKQPYIRGPGDIPYEAARILCPNCSHEFSDLDGHVMVGGKAGRSFLRAGH